MVSAEAGTGKHFPLSAFSMVISGSTESFIYITLRIKTAQKRPCISHELVNSMLFLSLVLILGDGRRPSDAWYFKWLNDLRCKIYKLPFFLLLNLCGLLYTLSLCLLSPKGQEHQISFRRKCLRWAIGHWKPSPGGVQKWEGIPFLLGTALGSLPPALGWLGEVIFVPCQSVWPEFLAGKPTGVVNTTVITAFPQSFTKQTETCQAKEQV